MILNRLFRKTPARERVVYEAIVAAARHPVPYENWGVADDLDGRFDMLSLHMFLALNRLKGEAGRFRQKPVEGFFAEAHVGCPGYNELGRPLIQRQVVQAHISRDSKAQSVNRSKGRSHEC